MKCLYCPQDLDVISDPMELSLSQCQSCHVTYRFNDETEPLIISWNNITLDTVRYCVKMYPGPTGNSPAFIIYYCKRIEVDKLDSATPWKTLVRFDFIPRDWTPQNATHKIRTYLPYL